MKRGGVMRNFWQGLLWGSFIGMLLSNAINPIMDKPKRKPLVERSADAVISTTHGLMRQARKRLMHKLS